MVSTAVYDLDDLHRISNEYCDYRISYPVRLATGFPSIQKVGAVGPELLYMIFIAGVIAVFTWNVGNKNLKPVNGVLFMNVVPVTTAIISVLQGYQITSIQLMGILAVMAGLTLNNFMQRRAARLSLAQQEPKLHHPIRSGN